MLDIEVKMVNLDRCSCCHGAQFRSDELFYPLSVLVIYIFKSNISKKILFISAEIFLAREKILKTLNGLCKYRI